MEFIVTGRTPGKKSETKRIRREGNIPAILYSLGEKGEEVVVDGIAFKKVLNTIERGSLSSMIFTLVAKDKKFLAHQGKHVRAIVKDIQYNITTYEVIHLDFEALHDDVPVNLNIPIKLTNILECPGVKLGGALRQMCRHMKVRCFPGKIPPFFEIDTLDLQVGQSKKLDCISIPEGVKPMEDLKAVAVVIARR